MVYGIERLGEEDKSMYLAHLGTLTPRLSGSHMHDNLNLSVPVCHSSF